jgi:hypothetical protein
VGQDDSTGTRLQGYAEDLARIHDGERVTSYGETSPSEHGPPAVQEEPVEFLVVQALQLGTQVCVGIRGGPNDRSLWGLSQGSTSQLESGVDADGTGFSHATNGPDLVGLGSMQAIFAELVEQGPGDLQRALAGHAGAEHEGHQLRITQPCGAFSKVRLSKLHGALLARVVRLQTGALHSLCPAKSEVSRSRD